MILELVVENFAIIDRINVKFSEGLNIITGETGTGKSIVVDAVNLLLGGRADKSFIRYGYETSLIEACFQLPEIHKTHSLIEDLGINIESDGILVVSREIHSNGRSISRINGRPVNLGILKILTPQLLDIQGQNENQKLLKKDEQIKLIDSLCSSESSDLRKQIRELYAELINLNKKLKEIDIDEMKKEREMEIINFQIEEIDSAELKVGEDELIMSEFRKIQKLDSIKTSIYKAIGDLDGDGYREGIVTSTYRIGDDIQNYSEEDDSLKSIAEELMNIHYSAQEISRGLNEYLRNIDYSEEELRDIESRIDLINSFKRKYGNTIEDINSYRKKIGRELEVLENIDEELTNIKRKISEKYDEVIKKSELVSLMRKEISLTMKEKIEKELHELNMSESVFNIDFKRREEPNEYGIDDIEFMISTNKGQPLKPITKVASGGEISRIMLGFKNIINEKDEVATLIFDEIDTGISGRTAQLVGEKILKVSKKNQIICITHLPQIAAMADHHFLISKSSDAGASIASIEELDYEKRISELSRLTGGVSVTDSTRKHAEDMLKLSKMLKSESED